MNEESICWGGSTWVFVAAFCNNYTDSNMLHNERPKPWSLVVCKRVKDLKEGDFVFTGSNGRFRRVQRLWQSNHENSVADAELVRFENVNDLFDLFV